MAMTKVYSTGGGWVDSMRMSYHIDHECMKPMGKKNSSKLKTMKNVCKRGSADL